MAAADGSPVRVRVRSWSWTYGKGEYAREESRRRLSDEAPPETDREVPCAPRSAFREGVLEVRGGDLPEVHLRYDRSVLGYPERDDFLLCTLQPGRALELFINGKRDFSLTGRRARTYTEQRWRVEVVGGPAADGVPAGPVVIDLRKRMY